MRKLILSLMLLFAFIINTKSQTKRALIVAIENYPQQSGWETLNTLNDVKLIQNSLLKQNFLRANINILTDSQATKSGIETGLNKLIESSGPGDIVVIHFSSHGEQLEDDNENEEVDGLDECIVPFDAIHSNDHALFTQLSTGYFRDDAFGEKITLLRNKLGKKGDVLVSLDACHSGSGTRGGGLKVRGSKSPMVSADFYKKKSTQKDSAGVFKEAVGVKLNADAASYIVISAAQAEELNSECFDDDQNVVGSLSYALSKSLNSLAEKITYRALFAQVEDILMEKVPKQKPVLEGDGIDRELFGGNYQRQKPYLTGTLDKTNKKKIILNGGTIAGVKTGSVISFYGSGTTSPEGKTPLETGIVEKADYFSSIVILKKINPGLENRILWAFITELNYGTKKLKLGIDSLSPPAIQTIQNGLKNYQLIDFKPPYDLYFGRSENGWALRYPGSGSVFTDNMDLNNIPVLKDILKRYDRFRFLRNLSFTKPGLSAKLQLVFLDKDGKIDRDKTNSRTKFGRLELREGDELSPIITNTGTKPIYINIVDIQPDGIINPVLPNKNLKDANNNPTPITWQDCIVKPKDTLRKKFTVTIAPPYGEETFKVFISTSPLDLEQILTTNGANVSNSRGPGGVLNKLATIFKESETNAIGSRGNPKINTATDGTIFNLNFIIVPK